MNYNVHLVRAESSFVLSIQNVDTVFQNDNAYFFYDAEGNTIFSAPLSKVIAIVKE